MARVLSTPRADRDLLGIGMHIAESSLRAANKMLGRIDLQCRMLARLPRLGRKREELAPRLRSYAVGPYVVYYRALRDGIEIIRVLHGARDIASHFE